MLRLNFIIYLVAMLVATQSVQANVSWSFSNSNCTGSDCSSVTSSIFTPGNTQEFDASSGIDSDKVTVSAFSTSDKTATGVIIDANLRLWGGGLGVYNAPSGDSHTTDNSNNIDFVKFSYGNDVSLDTATIGYISNNKDSDISVLAYNPSKGNGDKTLAGRSFSEILIDGWDFIAHYGNLVKDNPEAINSANYYSSDWVIAAYTPLVGNPGNWSNGNDFFKILATSGDIAPPTAGGSASVPEPSGIFLLLTGLAGWRFYQNGRNGFNFNLKNRLA